MQSVRIPKRTRGTSETCVSFGLYHYSLLLILLTVKEKYGSDFKEGDEDSETDSEEAESEDEDGEELTPAVDAAILRTLARIKRKDPDICNTDKGIPLVVSRSHAECTHRGTERNRAHESVRSCTKR
jgi:hypothetical protein